jgi:DNA-binding response OmpR family regulator
VGLGDHFGRKEFVARIEALLRRPRGAAVSASTYTDGRLSIAFDQHAVHFDDREVELTPLEFRLLATFVRHPNQVLGRNQLLGLVWGETAGVSLDQVKLYVGYLRRKLAPTAPDSTPIETVRGFGYRYRVPR